MVVSEDHAGTDEESIRAASPRKIAIAKLGAVSELAPSGGRQQDEVVDDSNVRVEHDRVMERDHELHFGAQATDDEAEGIAEQRDVAEAIGGDDGGIDVLQMLRRLGVPSFIVRCRRHRGLLRLFHRRLRLLRHRCARHEQHERKAGKHRCVQRSS